jgi:iron complex transport system ATP-binding protein
MLLDQVRVRLGDPSFGPFSLRLNAGERVAIVGPSGAGKSTLLRLMAGDLAPERGDIVFSGDPLRLQSALTLAQRRAVLPQNTQVAFDLPVPLVVALGRVSRRPDPQQDHIVEAALRCAQASHLGDRRYATLSGGEQARVQLARVLAQLWDVRAGLLLVDEPLASLDPGLALALMDSLQDFARERSHALVAVLHDINQALHRFDRLWMIKQGRVLADCAPVPAIVPLLEQLYDVRLRVMRDADGFAVLPASDWRPATAALPREAA